MYVRHPEGLLRSFAIPRWNGAYAQLNELIEQIFANREHEKSSFLHKQGSVKKISERQVNKFRLKRVYHYEHQKYIWPFGDHLII